jgi:RNA polymerase sigma-70 factor (ECF subfamily)
MKRETITSKKTKEMSVGRMADPATGVGLQDVLQQLLTHELMRAVERQHTLQKRENVVGWFYRILRNAIVDVYRSRATESKKTGTFLQDLIAAGEDKTPAFDELRPTVCACLQRLLPNIRPAYAELLRRVDLQELQVTPNNLTVRLHRARLALRTSLEKSCGLCAKHGCLNCTCD